MTSTQETLAKAREFDPTIAAWIDEMLKRGRTPESILKVLQNTVALVKAERALKDEAP